VSIKHARLAAALFALSAGRGAWGQISEADRVVGELNISPPTVVRTELTLSDLHGQKVASAPAGADGHFEFRHVPYGQYRLTVSDEENRPVHEEFISVREQQPPIEIHLTLPEKPKPASGRVSMQELLHPPGRKAVKLVESAQRLSAAGDHDSAAGQLQKAIRISPEYADAWINLGAEHVYLKQYEQALREFARAGELAGPRPMILCDIAFAQFALQRIAEATLSVREAVRLDPASAPAHYLLGSFLERDRRTLGEAIAHLEIAARSMPAARAELDRARRESAKAGTNP